MEAQPLAEAEDDKHTDQRPAIHDLVITSLSYLCAVVAREHPDITPPQCEQVC